MMTVILPFVFALQYIIIQNINKASEILLYWYLPSFLNNIQLREMRKVKRKKNEYNEERWKENRFYRKY